MRILILKDIAAPYRIPLLNELASREGVDLEVVFLSRNDPRRNYPFHESEFRFEARVLPEVNRRGIAALGMKSMGGEGAQVRKRAVRAEDALRYAMSLPVAVTITGIDSMKVLRQDLRIARSFVPMTREEMDALRKRSAPMAASSPSPRDMASIIPPCSSRERTIRPSCRSCVLRKALSLVRTAIACSTRKPLCVAR